MTEIIGRLVSVGAVVAVLVWFVVTMARNEIENARKRRAERRDQEWADRHDRPRSW